MIDDILEDDADEEMLRAAVAPEFAKKRQAENQWPKVTDCDRLDSAFRALDKRGILGLHNAGYTMSEGHTDAFEMLARQPKGRYFGYCFYHGQDVDRAVDGAGLMLAFDHVEGDVPDKLRVGVTVREELEKVGFSLDWDGTVKRRIDIPSFDWKRRSEQVG